MKIKWFGESKNTKRFFMLFYAVLVLLIIIEFFVRKHADLFFEGIIFFFPAYGFFSSILVFSALKIISKFLKKDADYYEQ